MNNVLGLQAMDVSFDSEGPLSVIGCPRTGSQYSIGCSTSSNACDVVGMGENYF